MEINEVSLTYASKFMFVQSEHPDLGDLIGIHEKPGGSKQARKEKPKTYKAEKIIGNGSFGVVYKALNDGEHVAIKKIYQDKRYKNRELQILKIIRHPFCIKLKHFFYTCGDGPDEVYLNVVMEHIPHTLHKVMKNYVNQK